MEPDDLCAACPHLCESGCAMDGEGTEQAVVRQDRDVARRLGIEPGASLRWGDILQRIGTEIAPELLGEICGSCVWLSLGHCEAGLRRLREP